MGFGEVRGCSGRGGDSCCWSGGVGCRRRDGDGCCRCGSGGVGVVGVVGVGCSVASVSTVAGWGMLLRPDCCCCGSRLSRL